MSGEIRSRRVWPALAILLLVGGTLTACGSQASKTPPPQVAAGGDQITGYLAVSPQLVTFIRLTRTTGALHGFLVQAADDGQGGTGSMNDSFHGTIAGSNITITASPDSALAAAFAPTIIGTLVNNRLTLSYPTQDGPMVTMHFHPATVADYNRAVAALAARSRHAASAAATATATVLASFCAVQSANQAIYLAVKGPTHQRICRRLLARSPHASEVRFTGSPSGYSWDCTVRYQGSLIRLYDAVPTADMEHPDRFIRYVDHLCAGLQRGALPQLPATL